MAVRNCVLTHFFRVTSAANIILAYSNYWQISRKSVRNLVILMSQKCAESCTLLDHYLLHSGYFAISALSAHLHNSKVVILMSQPFSQNYLLCCHYFALSALFAHLVRRQLAQLATLWAIHYLYPISVFQHSQRTFCALTQLYTHYTLLHLCAQLAECSFCVSFVSFFGLISVVLCRYGFTPSLTSCHILALLQSTVCKGSFSWPLSPIHVPHTLCSQFPLCALKLWGTFVLKGPLYHSRRH